MAKGQSQIITYGIKIIAQFLYFLFLVQWAKKEEIPNLELYLLVYQNRTLQKDG